MAVSTTGFRSPFPGQPPLSRRIRVLPYPKPVAFPTNPEYRGTMEKGDLVRLKIGGAVMVIDTISGGEAECIYLEGNKAVTGKFSLEFLEPLPSCDLSSIFPTYSE